MKPQNEVESIVNIQNLLTKTKYVKFCKIVIKIYNVLITNLLIHFDQILAILSINFFGKKTGTNSQAIYRTF